MAVVAAGADTRAFAERGTYRLGEKISIHYEFPFNMHQNQWISVVEGTSKSKRA